MQRSSKFERPRRLLKDLLNNTRSMELVESMPYSFLTPHVVNLLSENRQAKINLVLTCAMERVDIQTGEEESANIPFVSKTDVILDATDISEIYSNAISRIPETMGNFQMRGSNWRFMAVVKLDINTVTYKPLKGSSYISLPVELANKKAIIN